MPRSRRWRRLRTYRILVITALIMAIPAGLVGCIELYDHADKRGWIEAVQRVFSDESKRPETARR